MLKIKLFTFASSAEKAWNLEKMLKEMAERGTREKTVIYDRLWALSIQPSLENFEKTSFQNLMVLFAIFTGSDFLLFLC